MVEFRLTGPGRVTLVREGQEVGQVRWSIEDLAWDRERVKLARLAQLDCPEELLADLWDYLCYLWQKEAVAVARMPGGDLRWFHKALERSWRSAGSPLV